MEAQQEVHASRPQQRPSNRPQYRTNTTTTTTSPLHTTAESALLPPAVKSEPETPKPGPDRHVTFAETTPSGPEDSQESYPFNSDDEAFLATVDLGDGELGRPIIEDVDLGRPIGFDEERGEGGPGDTSITERAAVGQRQLVGGQASDVNRQDSMPRHTDKNSHCQPNLNRHTITTNSHSIHSHTNPNLAPDALPSHQQQQQQQQQRVLHPSNVNAATPTNTVHSKPLTTSETRQPRPPSVGGFHFPPGMVRPFFFLILWLALKHTVLNT
jgi:hypothetical protein